MENRDVGNQRHNRLKIFFYILHVILVIFRLIPVRNGNTDFLQHFPLRSMKNCWYSHRSSKNCEIYLDKEKLWIENQFLTFLPGKATYFLVLNLESTNFPILLSHTKFARLVNKHYRKRYKLSYIIYNRLRWMILWQNIIVWFLGKQNFPKSGFCYIFAVVSGDFSAENDNHE